MAHRCAYPPIRTASIPDFYAALAFVPTPSHAPTPSPSRECNPQTLSTLEDRARADTWTLGWLSHVWPPPWKPVDDASANLRRKRCALDELASPLANTFELFIAVNGEEGGGGNITLSAPSVPSPSEAPPRPTRSQQTLHRARTPASPLLTHHWRRTCSARTPADESSQPGAVQQPTASQSIAPSEPSEMPPRLTHPRHP